MARQQDVIIIGAGPTGLIIAFGLASAGARVTVLETRTDIVRSPRAPIYFPTTVKVLERLGLLDDVAAVALKVAEIDFRFPRSGALARFESTPADGEYWYNFHIGQDALSDIILRRLLQLPGARVLWGHNLERLSQTASGVTATCTTSHGEVLFDADWLVGADGARSVVRRELGVEFEGHTWPDRYVATNVFYDFGRFGYRAGNLFVDGSDWAMIARIDRSGLWRVTFGEDASLPEELLPGRVLERYRRLMPDFTLPHEMVAMAPYRVHERAATTFRVGRVLLAGDAAHVCNPLGGLGLTGAVLDASHLIEALNAVIHQDADDVLLDEYAAMRREVFLTRTSPMATGNKRRTQETDPQRQARDEAELLALAADPGGNARRRAVMAGLVTRPSALLRRP